jgi:D-tyrosyl-tRNA(Tyr) deacylase
MIALLQRVLEAEVKSAQHAVGSIDLGILLFLGISFDDGMDDISYIVDKVINLRIFSGPRGDLDVSVKNISGSILIISQFTLMASIKNGRRPNFKNAMTSDNAKNIYEIVVNEFIKTGINVVTGEFKSQMIVKSSNDGPFTIIVNSKDRSV